MMMLASSVRAYVAPNAKEDCVYTAHKISILKAFNNLVGRRYSCIQVYINAAPTWTGWENPWIIDYYDPNSNWSAWATTPGTQRQLIITQELIPSAIKDRDWLHPGAAGAYAAHARALAQHLVAAGLGSSIIRLSPEANGSWTPDAIPMNPAKYPLWVAFWRRTVLAMKSVAGAHFQFDWGIAALWRPIPLRAIYPGDDVVDMIGVDAYDTGNLGSTAAARWQRVLTGPDGLQDVLAFARLHHKPISIPEWGVSPTSQAHGFGDDPTFVNGIATVVRDDEVAYQAYFYNYDYATQLARGRGSLAAYRQHFGIHGDSVGATSPPVTPSGTRRALHRDKDWINRGRPLDRHPSR
ncbi:MAG TPA: hypothetical protein VMU39_20930 [Solirubrobacteraceae bacterium]|nr:hypothetical protein [Solirubrobacteraceae bacterium]